MRRNPPLASSCTASWFGLAALKVGHVTHCYSSTALERVADIRQADHEIDRSEGRSA